MKRAGQDCCTSGRCHPDMSGLDPARNDPATSPPTPHRTTAMPEADHPHNVGGDDTRAMTYDDLAKARNISRDSAIRLAQRRGWRQGRTNDGLVLVDAPVDALRRQDDAGGDGG